MSAARRDLVRKKGDNVRVSSSVDQRECERAVSALADMYKSLLSTRRGVDRQQRVEEELKERKFRNKHMNGFIRVQKDDFN